MASHISLITKTQFSLIDSSTKDCLQDTVTAPSKLPRREGPQRKSIITDIISIFKYLITPVPRPQASTCGCAKCKNASIQRTQLRRQIRHLENENRRRHSWYTAQKARDYKKRQQLQRAWRQALPSIVEMSEQETEAEDEELIRQARDSEEMGRMTTRSFGDEEEEVVEEEEEEQWMQNCFRAIGEAEMMTTEDILDGHMDVILRVVTTSRGCAGYEGC